MKNLLKKSFRLAAVAIPSIIILGALAYWLVPGFFKDSPNDDNNKEDIEEIDNFKHYEINYENDSIKIASLNFPSKEPYIPGVTEVWHINKLTGDSTMCVRSNPRYFGRGKDSIPSITRVVYQPVREQLIVEGPTCSAGYISTYIVDIQSGEYKCLPTNYGITGLTNWDNYIVATSKFSDIDYDLVLIYENIYVLDWDGNIISETSTKDYVIEQALPTIHREAGWLTDQIKLEKHIRLTPQYPDSLYYANEFRVKYHDKSIKEITNMGSSNSLPEDWSKHNHIYYYFWDDSEYGMFLTIIVDTKLKTGIIRKGAYTNPRNKPKRLYK